MTTGVNRFPDDMKTIRMEVAKPVGRGPEYVAWFWHPFRSSIQFAPGWFSDKLHAEAGSDLEVTWNPILERWQVWMRSEKVQNPVCWGWKLLFIHNGPSGEYLPLDERLFARLYSASAAKWGDGKRYMDAIVREMEREDEAREKRLTQEAIDQAMPWYDYSQIKNIGRGSKFSEYLA